jgi:NADH:ubiquinone oxidoreductase subunit F (NADH-binding)
MPRPPYPAEKGLYGKPTNINNVETWCNIPVIIEKEATGLLKRARKKAPEPKCFRW